MKICLIDTLGLSYDGSTLSKRGLGGSESAVIRISKELVKLGIDVTVFNDCTSDDTLPGMYDGVWYRPLSEVEVCGKYDAAIASRSLAPFAPVEIKERFKSFIGLPDFTRLQELTKHKIYWAHDTFCDGDDLLEPFILQGRLHEIFTLSDWHTSYITNCDHGTRRNYDILKKHIFQTRNGIGAEPSTWINIRDKDPNLFVFNASVTKGMVPLVESIWPRVKEKIPSAKLKIIGGYYRFREGSEPDEQEKQWREMVDVNPDIEFTGIIKQSEISNILAEASYMIYPAGFPETFGISTLEALAHNTPLITCTFGALEETAVDLASYKIPYPVEPNWALPWLNKDDQVDRFVNTVLEAYNNKYLHQQKMYACSQVRDICTWDTVALQWKQHLYKKTGKFLPVDEYRKVSLINHRVHEVFSRKFCNFEELTPIKVKELPIRVIAPTRNSEAYIENCILSVAQQDYDNYKMIIVDDYSDDKTFDIARKTIDNLPWFIQSKFELQKNRERKGAVRNQYEAVRNIKDPNTIVMLLDGDDWLVNDPNIFNKYNNIYQDKVTKFTYGSCWSLIDDIPLIAQEYPPEVKEAKSYRDYRFPWNMPYTHLRTFSAELTKDLYASEWKIDGEWPMAGGDTIVFYNLIERLEPKQIKVIPDIVLNYNDKNPANDYKIHGEEQTLTANKVLDMKKKFSVIMPTMWRCKDLTLKSLKGILINQQVDEILIIDNDKTRTPVEELQGLGPRVKIAQQETNIGVNPAWNLGVASAKNDLLCIVNDDIRFNSAVFTRVASVLKPGSGFYGLLKGDPSVGQPPVIEDKIKFKQYQLGDNIHCFGQLFFFHREDWIDIPEVWTINYGDEFIFHSQIYEKKNPINLIYDCSNRSENSATVNDPTVELANDEALKADEAESWKLYFERFYQEGNSGDPTEWIWAQKERSQKQSEPKKKILIAIPTAKYIEPETFKSIWNLEAPDGYELDFQYFFGYQTDQVRNLIASWAIKGYDYLFAVDSDITFPPDTLKRLKQWDVDLCSGVYRQRLEPQALEVYGLDFKRLEYDDIAGSDPVEIGGCGFGCVLVKSKVLEEVGYPQFEYHSALDHKDTFSEDNDFCMKARQKGFRLWCDPNVLCGHIGSITFDVYTG